MGHPRRLRHRLGSQRPRQQPAEGQQLPGWGIRTGRRYRFLHSGRLVRGSRCRFEGLRDLDLRQRVHCGLHRDLAGGLVEPINGYKVEAYIPDNYSAAPAAHYHLTGATTQDAYVNQQNFTNQYATISFSLCPDASGGITVRLDDGGTANTGIVIATRSCRPSPTTPSSWPAVTGRRRRRIHLAAHRRR